MTKFRYECAVGLELYAQLRKPLRAAAARLGPAARPYKLLLSAADGSVLTIASQEHDVTDRHEVAVLCFSLSDSPCANDVVLEVPPVFNAKIVPEKLVVVDSDIESESGLCLRANSEEILVCAGAYPYSIAFSGLGALTHGFEPEFPVDKYVRVPFQDRD